MKTNRFAAERGIKAGREGAGEGGNPFRRRDRRELWERGRQNGAKGGFPCGAIAPHPPTLVCKCGHCGAGLMAVTDESTVARLKREAAAYRRSLKES